MPPPCLCGDDTGESCPAAELDAGLALKEALGRQALHVAAQHQAAVPHPRAQLTDSLEEDNEIILI